MLADYSGKSFFGNQEDARAEGGQALDEDRMRDPKELGQVCTLNSFGPIARGRNHAVRVCHRAELCYAHQVLVDHGQGSNCKDFTIDQALDHVGGFGAFQRWNTFLLGTVWLLCGMFALGPVSWNIKMMHDMGWGGCREEQLANTVYFGAQFIANAAWGPAADRLGRRSVLLAALGFAGVGGLLTALSRTFQVYLFARAVCGFGTAGMTLVTTVLLSEVVEAQSRSLVVCFYLQVFYSIGMCALVPSASLFERTNWRTEVATPTLITLAWLPLCLTFLRESPRYLAAKGLLSAALTEVSIIGERNSHPLPRDARLISAHILTDGGGKTEAFGTLDLFRGPRLRLLTVVMCTEWLIIGCVYFGLTLAASSFGGSIHFNLFMSAIVEVPAYAVSFRAMDVVGRRPVFLCFNAVAALCCVSYFVAPPTPICISGLPCGSFNLRTLLAVCGKWLLPCPCTAAKREATSISQGKPVRPRLRVRAQTGPLAVYEWR
jgi:MFS family permease